MKKRAKKRMPVEKLGYIHTNRFVPTGHVRTPGQFRVLEAVGRGPVMTPGQFRATGARRGPVVTADQARAQSRMRAINRRQVYVPVVDRAVLNQTIARNQRLAAKEAVLNYQQNLMARNMMIMRENFLAEEPKKKRDWMKTLFGESPDKQ